MSNKTRIWLFNYLFDAGGPVPSQQVMEAAKAAGFTRRQIQRARELLNVSFVRSRTVPSITYWELTYDTLSPLDDLQAHNVPRWAREEIDQLRLKIKELQLQNAQLRNKINKLLEGR